MPKSFETPIDLRLLSAGNLIVLPDVLSHVYLMPSSNGRSEVSVNFKKIWKDNDIGFHAYQCVINDAKLTNLERMTLSILLSIQKLYSRIRIVPYYLLAAKAPNLARKLKKVWFKVFVQSS